jgi:hypothetical protein
MESFANVAIVAQISAALTGGAVGGGDRLAAQETAAVWALAGATRANAATASAAGQAIRRTLAAPPDRVNFVIAPISLWVSFGGICNVSRVSSGPRSFWL